MSLVTGTPLTVASTVEVSAEFCWPPQAARITTATIRVRERSAIRMESPRGWKTSRGFVGRERLNAECVNVGLVQIAERRVDHAVALQPILAGKRRCHDAHEIMAATGMRVTGMLCAIVADFQLQGPEFSLHVHLQILHARVRS